MKEAFGGTFTLKLIMVFFVIYVTFLGVALNIAKAYRIKNHVINILEQKQFDITGANKDSTLDEIRSYLIAVPYSTTSQNIQQICKKTAGSSKYDHSTGVCIIQNSGNYYKVIVYMYVEFPFFDIKMMLPISGETMTIVK